MTPSNAEPKWLPEQFSEPVYVTRLTADWIVSDCTRHDRLGLNFYDIEELDDACGREARWVMQNRQPLRFRCFRSGVVFDVDAHPVDDGGIEFVSTVVYRMGCREMFSLSRLAAAIGDVANALAGHPNAPSSEEAAATRATPEPDRPLRLV